MKKKTLLSLLLGLLIVTSNFAQKTIENPEFEVKVSGLNNISKIEMTDTETRLHIHYTFLPKWWTTFEKDYYLEDCDTGKKYPIIEVINVEFGKKQWMPMSGEDDFVLIFPPLDKGVKKINYGDAIFGISLTEQQKDNKENKVPKKVTKWFKKELAKVKTEPLKDFNSPHFFNKKPAKLIGYIKGYDPRLGFETGIMYMRNNITREDYPIVVQIYTDGRFEAELPLIHPEHTYLNINKANINLYIEPEQTLVMILDWNEFLIADRFRNDRHQFKNIEFLGPLAQVNYDLLHYNKKDFDYTLFKKQQTEITPAAFKKLQSKTHQNNTIHLLKYLTTHDVSDKATVLLKNKNILNNANLMFNFVMNRDYYAKKDTLNEVLKIPVENKYYDFLNKIDLNDNSLLVNNNFSEFINRFEYCKLIMLYPKNRKTKPAFEKTFFEYALEHKIEIDPEYQKIFTTREKLDKEFKLDFYNKNKEAFDNYQKKYKKEWSAYFKEKFPNKPSMSKWHLRDSALVNVLKLDKNLMYEIAKVRDVKYAISNTEKSKYAYEYWDELKKDISNPFLKEEGTRMVHKQFPLVNSESAVKTTKLPEGKPTEVFKGIVDKYKGKILFIDFWATSCAPCIGGIERMKETRKKYENHPDFDFLFITDERGSPKNKYDDFVKEQELKNIYRLSTDEYNYLRQLFQFNGIPRYVVIDKKGDVIDGHFAMHNFDSLLDPILKEHK